MHDKLVCVMFDQDYAYISCRKTRRNGHSMVSKCSFNACLSIAVGTDKHIRQCMINKEMGIFRLDWPSLTIVVSVHINY